MTRARHPGRRRSTTTPATRQIAYRTDAGNRIPEVAAYGNDSLLVLLDNYEGMAITFGGPGLAGVSMISDDNFSATQFTRVLNLLVKLP